MSRLLDLAESEQRSSTQSRPSYSGWFGSRGEGGEKTGQVRLVLSDTSLSKQVGGGTTECVILPLKHGRQVDHGGGVVCL